MTTEATASANRVIVVGALDTVRDRGKQATTRRQRNELRGTMERVALQVRSPFGGTFQLPLEFEPAVKGRELLRDAQAGEIILAEGHVQLKKTFDARFAQDAQDPGREIHEMALHVHELRAPTDEERLATSAVWLAGVVAQPIRLIRHPELPNVQLATTILEVTMQRPSPFPGSRSVQSERVRVRVAMPTSHPHAGLLYRPGNVVCAEGEVDCLLETQGGEEVRAAVDARRAEWAAQESERAALSAQDQRAAERRFRRDLQRLTQAPRVQVLLGYVELREGAPATLDESQELRRAFVRQARARRRSNAAMRATASGRGRGPSERMEQADMSLEMLAEPAADADPAPVTIAPTRPRRTGRAAMNEIQSQHPIGATPLDRAALEQDVAAAHPESADAPVEPQGDDAAA